jgi:hypothetical protein
MADSPSVSSSASSRETSPEPIDDEYNPAGSSRESSPVPSDVEHNPHTGRDSSCEKDYGNKYLIAASIRSYTMNCLKRRASWEEPTGNQVYRAEIQRRIKEIYERRNEHFRVQQLLKGPAKQLSGDVMKIIAQFLCGDCDYEAVGADLLVVPSLNRIKIIKNCGPKRSVYI